jgi:hypothetical protein
MSFCVELIEARPEHQRSLENLLELYIGHGTTSNVARQHAAV